MSERLRIVVLGYLVRFPLGGMAWHHVQYVAGLHDLGHDVWFVEDSGDESWGCYDPLRHENGRDPSTGLGFAAAVFDRLGLPHRWAYHDAHTGRWLGPAACRLPSLFREVDLVVDVSGVNALRPWILEVPRRVLIDTDPVFTQIRAERGHGHAADAHTSHFTFGERLAAGLCPEVPDAGRAWLPTRQPVVLRLWEPTAGDPAAPFSTVMQWDAYGEEEWEGRSYGMKSRSFRRIAGLPRRCPTERFELAVGGDVPYDRLRRLGWSFCNPLDVTRDLDTYQAYLRGSKAEFTPAKQGYVAPGSGWFSERSACYLASGRPVVCEDSGFTELLPTGDGLLAYTTADEARAAIEAVCARYERHQRAARDIAVEYFDARTVLQELCEQSLR